MEQQKTFIPSKWVGAIAGVFLGFVWVRYGLGSTIFIACLGALGYAIAGILTGEIDILDLLTRLQQRNKPF